MTWVTGLAVSMELSRRRRGPRGVVRSGGVSGPAGIVRWESQAEEAAISPGETLRRSQERHGRTYILKTPYDGAGTGAWEATARPIPSTRRVSAGSRTPSSHSRAVE